MWSSILGEADFGERWSASECSRCRHGCATSLHDDEDLKLGGKTVSEVRSLTSCHEKEHKNEGEIIRKKDSRDSEYIILNETRGNKVLKCMYANVRSIVSVQKRAELEWYINNETPDIIGITESWTKPEMADSELALDGYRLFRKDPENQRTEGHGAGGVLLYVKSSFNAVERWDMCNETFKESVSCEIQLKKSKLLVGVCYMVPDATEEANQGMCKLLERANKETSLIMGDFNYHVDWENSEGEREQDRLFLDFIEASFMQQHVMEPTRVDNILDLVISLRKI